MTQFVEPSDLRISLDDLSDPRIHAFLNQHIEDMRAVSPPESKHALDIEGLKASNIRFWSVWIADDLVACAALKHLTTKHAEVKSMRVAQDRRGQGIAKRVLKHLINEAAQSSITQLSLETGSMDFFKPARELYARFGFTYCGPFAEYKADPNSVFMTKCL